MIEYAGFVIIGYILFKLGGMNEANKRREQK
jgi:hypothetical protein